MKRDKNFYCAFIMVFFVVIFVTAFILTNRTISAGKLIATASIIIYPMTYFIGTIFSERYGKDKYFNLLVYSIVALLACVVFISCSGLLPASKADGLDKMFNIDYRAVFAFITAFLTGQILNLVIYYFLDKKKGFNFLISSVIAITIDSLLFVLLTYVGTVSFTDLVQIFSGQYVLSVIMMIIYSMLFAYTIDTVVKTKKNKEDMENIILERTSSIKAVNINNKAVKKEVTKKVIKSDEKPKTVKKVSKKEPVKKSTTKKTTK